MNKSKTTWSWAWGELPPVLRAGPTPRPRDRGAGQLKWSFLPGNMLERKDMRRVLSNKSGERPWRCGMGMGVRGNQDTGQGIKSAAGEEGRNNARTPQAASHLGMPHVTVLLIRSVLLTILAETNVKVGLCTPFACQEVVEAFRNMLFRGIPCGINEFSRQSSRYRV